MSFVRTDDEAIARAAKHSDRPNEYVSLAAKRKVQKDSNK
ncbi:hypothetical protein COO91_01122 [Nostoc flagelliforme CCNUN1]|uniref:Uncharacterized protein n=1 Tax=Nostoc flagelliforme CCNUN1 TaxID=2038116 RepID=A0A2K8SIE8_9NOSO|nr:hypothetical protein COO91_01122 [Nostoc flagelliforme CCNUN1]